MKKRGFTLLELIIVIAILGVLTAAVLPRFVNMQTEAINNTEDAIFGSLKEGVITRHLESVSNGNDAWPGDANDSFSNDVFDVLSPAPTKAPFSTPPDGESWRFVNDPPATEWRMFCPHFVGTMDDGSDGSRGRMFVYAFGASSPTRNYSDKGNVKLSPGEIGTIDWGH